MGRPWRLTAGGVSLPKQKIFVDTNYKLLKINQNLQEVQKDFWKKKENLPFALRPVTLYCPGPGPMLSILPLCLAPKLKAGARPLFDSDVFLPRKNVSNTSMSWVYAPISKLL